MDLIVLVAIVLFGWGVLVLLVAPFLIGETRTYKAGNYLMDAVLAIFMIIVAGRIFSWW